MTSKQPVKISFGSKLAVDRLLVEDVAYPEVGCGESVAGGHVGAGGGVGVVGVDVGEQRGHVGRHPRAQVLGRQAVEVGHGLVDGLDAVAQRELVHNLLAGLVEVNLPALLALGVGQVDLAGVLLTQVVEEVLVQARVLDVVRGNLDN